MARLRWDKLLNGNRVRTSESFYHKQHRNEFDKDYDRIIYSSSLRRLQDKAQLCKVMISQEQDLHIGEIYWLGNCSLAS